LSSLWVPLATKTTSFSLTCLPNGFALLGFALLIFDLLELISVIYGTVLFSA
jgi:hypothetical protein